MSFRESLVGSFNGISAGIVKFLPYLLGAIVTFIASWIIGAFVGKLVAHIFRALKVDEMLEKAGFNRAISRAGLTLNSGALVGGLVKWFIIVIGLVAAFDIIGLVQVNIFLQSVVLLYLPQVIVAVLILLVSIVIADVVSKIVQSSAKAAGVRSANFLGTMARWAIWIFGILMALVQLQIATTFIQTLFTGVVVALAIAFGLSFGLGGQEAAARYIEKVRQDISEHKNN